MTSFQPITGGVPILPFLSCGRIHFHNFWNSPLFFAVISRSVDMVEAVWWKNPVVHDDDTRCAKCFLTYGEFCVACSCEIDLKTLFTCITSNNSVSKQFTYYVALA